MANAQPGKAARVTPLWVEWEPDRGANPGTGEIVRLIAIERDTIFADALLLAQVAYSGGNCRNSDLAVAVIEFVVLALGVFGLR